MDFEKIEELALKFAINMNHNGLSMGEISQNSLNAAIAWEARKQDRLEMFHSDQETRSNWSKASGNKITLNDVNQDSLGKGTYYWIIPTNQEQAVYAKFRDFDGITPLFEDPEDEMRYYEAREILLL